MIFYPSVKDKSTHAHLHGMTMEPVLLHKREHDKQVTVISVCWLCFTLSKSKLLDINGLHRALGCYLCDSYQWLSLVLNLWNGAHSRLIYFNSFCFTCCIVVWMYSCSLKFPGSTSSILTWPEGIFYGWGASPPGPTDSTNLQCMKIRKMGYWFFVLFHSSHL